MKTQIILFAALFISTITFSQSPKKGHNYYKAKSDDSKSQKMNKGELIEAIAKNTEIGFGTTSISKRTVKGSVVNPRNSTNPRKKNGKVEAYTQTRGTRTAAGRNPQTGDTIKGVKVDKQVFKQDFGQKQRRRK